MGNAGRTSSVRPLAASAFLAAGIGGILIACGAGDTSDSGSPSPTTTDVTNGGTTVGPEGGTFTENGVTVTIPAGALAASTPIHITESTVVPNGYAVSGKVYRFEPSGTHFSAPITIALPSTKPEIVYWTIDGSETEFEPVETEFDEVAATAKVQITHFSGGFVGTTPNGITCVVKQPSGTCGQRTTIESPAFWYGPSVVGGNTSDWRNALATNSIGLNRYINRQAGDGILLTNSTHTQYKMPTGVGDHGTANVSGDMITSFTGSGARGEASTYNCTKIIPLIDYTCSGGNVRIGYGPPAKPADAGVSLDSGSFFDGGTDSSTADAASSTDASVEDGGEDSAIGDSGIAEDSSVSDSGTVEDAGVTDSGSTPADSGMATDSGVADSGVPNGITCTVVKYDVNCLPFTTTVETPKFWYTKGVKGELATDSTGLNLVVLRHYTPQGATLYYANATFDRYDASQPFDQLGVALVSGDVITKFTADGTHTSTNPKQCLTGPGALKFQFQTTVKCSGGNVTISKYPP